MFPCSGMFVGAAHLAQMGRGCRAYRQISPAPPLSIMSFRFRAFYRNLSTAIRLRCREQTAPRYRPAVSCSRCPLKHDVKLESIISFALYCPFPTFLDGQLLAHEKEILDVFQHPIE